ncbi:hypothetical protein GCM10009618_25210 [Nesterenkonia lacusekhoensis]
MREPGRRRFRRPGCFASVETVSGRNVAPKPGGSRNRHCVERAPILHVSSIVSSRFEVPPVDFRLGFGLMTADVADWSSGPVEVSSDREHQAFFTPCTVTVH